MTTLRQLIRDFGRGRLRLEDGSYIEPVERETLRYSSPDGQSCLIDLYGDPWRFRGVSLDASNVRPPSPGPGQREISIEEVVSRVREYCDRRLLRLIILRSPAPPASGN